MTYPRRASAGERHRIDSRSRERRRAAAFTTERLTVGVERATETVREAFEGLTATDTGEEIAFRTTDGTLVAVVTGGQTAEFHYRTAPASASATLKARRAWRALEPCAASS